MPDPLLADPVVHDPEGEPAFEAAERRPKPGTALCLSGGGYRAMLFHARALWRLNGAGMLRNSAAFGACPAVRSPLACLG